MAVGFTCTDVQAEPLILDSFRGVFDVFGPTRKPGLGQILPALLESWVVGILWSGLHWLGLHWLGLLWLVFFQSLQLQVRQRQSQIVAPSFATNKFSS